MQPYIFPYLGYFQLINAVDRFIVYDDVNFINKGWINRNSILVDNKSFTFTIPLIEASQNRPINEIELVEGDKWRDKLLRTIEHSYKKSPNFSDAYSLITGVIKSDITYISQLAILSLKTVCNYLNILTKFIDSSGIYENRHLKGQMRILSICEKEAASQYINPIGGLELYSRELFEMERIKLNFLKSNDIFYKQYDSEFVPNLSIIDVLMFNSRDAIRKKLDLFELI